MGFKEHANLYYERTKNDPISPFVYRASLIVPPENRKTAVDIGCGAFSNTKGLIGMGFYTHAIDSNYQVRDYANGLEGPLFNLIIDNIENIHFPASTIDFVVALEMLHFMNKSAIEVLFKKIARWLTPQGVFAGNLLGTEDAWNTPGSNLTFFEKVELNDLLENAGLSIFMWQQVVSSEPTALGHIKNYWSRIQFIAQISTSES